MKKYFLLFGLFYLLSPFVEAQQATPVSASAISYAVKTENDKLTKNMLQATQGLSHTLGEQCKPAMFMVEFVLGEAGKFTDSIHIVASDSSYSALIDQNKLKAIPVEWSSLVNKNKLRKGTRIFQPVLIVGYEENCSNMSVPPREILNTFSYLNTYTHQLNETAFLLNLMEIKVTVSSCGPAPKPIVPLAQKALPATEGR